MKAKTTKQPNQSKPTTELKDMKPKKDPKGGLGGGITKLGSKRLVIQGDT